MPICNKPPPQAATKSAAEVDDHASEAAKVKRTREQAYFNSYNFDAIEVLPYDDEDDENDAAHHQHTTKSSNNNNNNNNNTPVKYARALSSQGSLPKQQTSLSSKSNSSAHTCSDDGSSRSSSRSSSGRYLRSHQNDKKYTSYLQRLGAFFANSQHAVEPAEHFQTTVDVTKSVPNSRGTTLQIPTPMPHPQVKLQQKSITNDERASGAVVASTNAANAAIHVADNGNFLLPRAMLKYQSVGITNSMPLAVISSSSPASSSSLLLTAPSFAITATTTLSTPTIPASTTGTTAKLLQNGTNNSSMFNSNKKLSASLTNNTSNNVNSTTNILHSNNKNNSNTNSINKTRLHQAKSQAGHTGFLITSEKVVLPTKTTTAATATATAKTLTRNKKQSTSSTTTNTSDSAVSMEHDLEIATTTATAAEVGATAGNTNRKSFVTKSNAITAASSTSTEGEQRGRSNSHQSHYSTDKSGSSGYYSSNVCSTYSLEDHIYCEPVIDILDVNKSKSMSKSVFNDAGKASRRQQVPKPIATTTSTVIATTTSAAATMAVTMPAAIATKPNGSQVEQNKMQTLSRVRDMNGVGQSKRYGTCETATNDDDADDDDGAADDDDDESDGVEKTVTLNALSLRRKHSQHHNANNAHHFNENLRILETSIENLDRHLKNFPSLSSQEHTASFVHHIYQPATTTLFDNGVDKFRPLYQHLPTIMEGNDPVSQTSLTWPDDIVDDSLLDIDLDSFLLANERQNNKVNHKLNKALKSSGVNAAALTKAAAAAATGIDNPSFLTDEQEENNYKCAKYINSCPEDAYRVESDIMAAGTGSTSQKSNSMEHFLKRYEDQIHFQNTRELLEDVRDKIRLLSHTSSELRSSSADSQEHGSALDAELPKELESMITTLKSELESYLTRMNQHSELEIRQLCSGLVKNQNIVKMQKAFERRRSTNSLNAFDTEYDFATYEAVRGDGALVNAAGMPVTIRQQITSIRCASDPNFKMKRKSLAEVFPLTDCYVETVEHEKKRDATHTHSQLQRNLSFQKPILNQLNAKIDAHRMESIVTAGNSGSGAVGAGAVGVGGGGSSGGASGAESGGDKDSILEWHRKRPSIWEMYYGTNRMSQSLLGKRNGMIMSSSQVTMSYPSSRPESDFTLDLPRAEQLRIKMEKEKKFRQRCRYITTFLSLIFFLLTVMVVSLVLTRGKRMFGSMI